MIRAAASVAAALVTAGCVVYPHDAHYRPLASPSVRVLKEMCGGRVGPPTTVEVTGPRGVVVTARVDRRDDGLAATVWVGSREVSGADFVSDEFALEDLGSGERRPLVSKRSEAPTAPPELRVRRALAVRAFQPPRVRLHLPEVRVGGDTMRVAPADFEWRPSDWGVYPLNC